MAMGQVDGRAHRTYADAWDETAADPAFWAHVARQAAAYREYVDHGSPAWSVLTRLSSVIGDLLDLDRT